MKKRIMLAAAAASLVMLTGCLAETYPLTEEEQDIIAEYAAAVLLRNDENYTQALVTPTPMPTLEPTPSPTPVPTNAADGSGEDKPTGKGESTAVTQNATLSEVYGLEGLSVVYEGFDVWGVIEAENNDDYVVRAGEGKVLLEVGFTLTNTAGVEQKFKFGTQGISYRLDCGGKSFISPMITAFDGDLLFMDVTLAAGQSCEGFVVFEVPGDTKTKDVKVVVSRGNDYTSVIPLE